MRLSIQTFRTSVFLLFMLFLFLTKSPAADVSLAWDASTSPNIAGYKVYVGTASRTYGAPIQIGNQTTYTVTGLGTGTYYFAVSAFNTSGNESGFSNEISTAIASGAVCDINNDKATNVLDLQLMVNIILGQSPSSGSYDMNKDGRVDVLDLQVLTNVVLGLRSCP
jgi:hypothetical protein